MTDKAATLETRNLQKNTRWHAIMPSWVARPWDPLNPYFPSDPYFSCFCWKRDFHSFTMFHFFHLLSIFSVFLNSRDLHDTIAVPVWFGVFGVGMWGMWLSRSWGSWATHLCWEHRSAAMRIKNHKNPMKTSGIPCLFARAIQGSRFLMVLWFAIWFSCSQQLQSRLPVKPG